jgi:hypothetical protein
MAAMTGEMSAATLADRRREQEDEGDADQALRQEDGRDGASSTQSEEHRLGPGSRARG